MLDVSLFTGYRSQFTSNLYQTIGTGQGNSVLGIQGQPVKDQGHTITTNMEILLAR